MEGSGGQGLPPAGWYPNPEGSGERYWNGSMWMDSYRDSTPTQQLPPQQQQAPQYQQPQSPHAGARAPMRQKPKPPWWRRWWAIALAGLVLLIVIGALTSSGSDDSSTSSNEPASGEKAEDSGSSKDNQGADASSDEKDDCGTTATDDCTPSVGPNGKVRVDALTWQIVNVTTAKSLGDASIGLDEQADGVFVITTLRVHSNKDESATLSDDVIKLTGKGTEYSADNEGTVAAIGSGQDPLFFEDLGPDQTTTSKVVFDVPPRVLKQSPKLRFNELGLGSTHAFIALPPL